jgi:hypothetical protein
MDLNSLFQKDDSVVAGIMTMALIAGFYNFNVGTAAAVHMTPANDINVSAGIRKAGIMSAATITGLFLLSHDSSVVILGSATIIAEELTYRHANLASPESGMISIVPSDYAQAPTTASVSQGTDNY